MNQAVIGLVGIVLGGAIAVFAQQLRPNARSVRGAARLLHGELDLTLKYANDVLDAQSWQPGGRALSTALWADRRSLLAAELGRSDWTAVSAAYEAVQEIRAAKRSERALLSEAETGLFNRSVAEIKGACDVLDYLSGPLPTITQWLRRRRGG